MYKNKIRKIISPFKENKKESSKETYILDDDKGSEEKLVLVGEAEDGEEALRIAKKRNQIYYFNNNFFIDWINGDITSEELKANLEKTIRDLLKIDILIEKSLLPKDPVKLREVFNRLEKNISNRSKKTPIVLEIEKYINKNYSNDKLTIDDVAKNIRISQTYLTRLLKKETGMSFIDYLTYIRIQNAIELMKDPTIKIYEIATLVGYNTQHYFSNVFKKHMGVSPNYYRNYINNEE